MSSRAREDRERRSARVREIIAQSVAGSGERAPKPEDTLEALGIDSLDRIEIAIDIEKEFRVGGAPEIPDEESAGWKTVADVIATAGKGWPE